MATSVVIRLDPSKLSNPDLDIRYALPELISDRAGGRVADDGYDYDSEDRLLVFLTTDGSAEALQAVLRVIQRESVLGNVLRDSVEVGVGGPEEFQLVYPPEATGGTIEVEL